MGEDSVLASVEKLTATARQLEKELEAQKRKGALNQLDDLFNQAQTIKGVKVIVGEVSNVDREGLRQLVDSLRQKLGSGVVALGMPDDGKVALIAGVTKDLTAKVHAGKLIQALAKQVGGSGRRPAGFGRGWRKRHIRLKKCPAECPWPPRTLAIIPGSVRSVASRKCSISLYLFAGQGFAEQHRGSKSPRLGQPATRGGFLYLCLPQGA